MSSRVSFVVLLASLAFETVQAYYVNGGSRTSGGLIGGVVIAAVAFAFFLLMLCLLMRRIKARRAYQSNNYNAPPQPLFGGPWGRQQTSAPMANAPIGSQSNAGYNGGNSTGGAPPPYEKPGMNEAHTQGPTNPNATYAPPPVPPPAHTAGQDNTFVGGFRQGNTV